MGVGLRHAGVAAIATSTGRTDRTGEASTGYLGGEKIGLFDDAQVQGARRKQGIAIDYRKAGSLAMMDADRKGMDYLFPSSRAPSNTAMRKASRPPKATSSSTHRLCYTRTRPWRTGS